MINFLFWNVHRTLSYSVLANLAKKYDLDVIILAETKVSPEQVRRSLHNAAGIDFNYPNLRAEKVQIFTRFSPDCVKPVYEDRITISKLKLPDAQEFLLAAAHMQSKIHYESDDQTEACKELAGHIVVAEDGAGHQLTMLVVIST